MGSILQRVEIVRLTLMIPIVGFPLPIPPRGVSGRPPLPPQRHHHHHHHHGYQTVTNYVVVEGRPVREHRFLFGVRLAVDSMFIMGFFLGGIPWYIGTFILLCVMVDYREKPGYVACTTFAIQIGHFSRSKKNYIQQIFVVPPH
ncbi:60S ribosomal protein L18a-like protein [Argentina anserina]|uniref:60S ribosomal protein L18a-like protein n=1 Tax=Argentina anserina TaxID=57926 RepID=UPI00217668AD|nr:60S ribosomal protein L18a-like protein [Potentilla anserina]